MGFNHNKRGGFNLTLVVQDETWRKVSTFKWNTADKKKQNSILKTVEDAFGISLRFRSDMDWVND